MNCGVLKQQRVYWDLKDTVGLAFTCTQHFAVHHNEKENSLIHQLPAPLTSDKLCESVCICDDAFPSETQSMTVRE